MFRRLRSKSTPHGDSSSYINYHRVYPEAPVTKDDSGVFTVGPDQFLDTPSSNSTDDGVVSDRASDSGSGEDEEEDEEEEEEEDGDDGDEDEDDIINNASRAHSSATCSSVDYGPWTEEQLREWKSFCSKWGLD